MNRHTMPYLAASLALVVLFSSLPRLALGDLETGFVNGQVKAGGKTMLYVAYVPSDYSPAKQWPVILYLHHAGSEGTDGFTPVTDALGLQLWLHPQWFPCLAVFPQLPSAGNTWSGPYEDLALQALRAVVSTYNGDPNRLYATGASIGGAGTWQLVYDHPTLFAAALPTASAGFSGSPAQVAARLKTLPLWVFHGGADSLASPAGDRKLVAAIQAAGNPNIQYTEYPGIGHDCWDVAYSDPKVIQWLLAQKR